MVFWVVVSVNGVGLVMRGVLMVGQCEAIYYGGLSQ